MPAGGDRPGKDCRPGRACRLTEQAVLPATVHTAAIRATASRTDGAMAHTTGCLAQVAAGRRAAGDQPSRRTSQARAARLVRMSCITRIGADPGAEDYHMQKSSKSRAAQQFTATQKKTARIMTEIEKTRQERSDNMAKQRTQRLDKEAADRETADRIAAEKAAKR